MGALSNDCHQEASECKAPTHHKWQCAFRTDSIMYSVSAFRIPSKLVIPSGTSWPARTLTVAPTYRVQHVYRPRHHADRNTDAPRAACVQTSSARIPLRLQQAGQLLRSY